MTDNEIIEKASKALKALDLFREDFTDITVSKTVNELLLENAPELKEIYSVIFTYKQPDGRGAITSIDVDRKTHKLIKIITKSNMYDIPFELR